MAKEMMDEIRRAELQAAETIREARGKAADIEAQAKAQAQERIEKAKAEAAELVRSARESARMQGEKEAAETAAEGAKDVEALRVLSAGKEQEAVKLVIAEIAGSAG